MWGKGESRRVLRAKSPSCPPLEVEGVKCKLGLDSWANRLRTGLSGPPPCPSLLLPLFWSQLHAAFLPASVSPLPETAGMCTITIEAFSGLQSSRPVRTGIREEGLGLLSIARVAPPRFSEELIPRTAGPPWALAVAPTLLSSH